jgi:uncharacterized protein (TIRG00374 family)
VRRAIQMTVGIVISAVCVWLSMREVRLDEVWRVLKDANFMGFVLVMVITIFGFWLRAIRWRMFLQAGTKVSTHSLFSATMIGFMANNVLPLRLGEFVRPWVLARRERLSNSMLLATVVVERAIDMLTLLALFGVSLMLHPIAENTEAGKLVQEGARLLLLLCSVLTVMVVVMERNRGIAHAMLGIVPGRFRPRAHRLTDRFLEGFGLFRDIGKLLEVFALSFAMFLCYAVALGISMWSLHIDVPIYTGLVMLVVTAIGIMVPAAPGYVGTLNYACVVGLALFGVGKASSSALGWFYFFSQWLPITSVGLVYLNREGLSLRSLGQAHETPK